MTSFQYRLHALGPMVFGGSVLYPFTRARELLRGYSDFIATAPDELAVSVYLVPTPDHQRVVTFDVCYCGPVADGERAVAPLRKLGKPLKDNLGPISYVETQRSGDADNPPGRYYIKGVTSGLSPPHCAARSWSPSRLHRWTTLRSCSPMLVVPSAV